MTSSRFSGKQTIKLPAVCHKELYDLPAVYATDLPTQLSVLAVWKDANIPVYLAESFALLFDAGLPGWAGVSGVLGFNLAVTIVILPVDDTYDLTISLRSGATVLDDDSWHDQVIKPPRPFDSGLLFHDYGPPTDYNEIRVLN
jgi:hypothetical protein